MLFCRVAVLFLRVAAFVFLVGSQMLSERSHGDHEVAERNGGAHDIRCFFMFMKEPGGRRQKADLTQLRLWLWEAIVVLAEAWTLCIYIYIYI